MSNYLMIDGSKIGISDETASNLKEQFGKKEERFYKGERFVTKGGVEYVLASIEFHPVLIEINTGNTKGGLKKSITFQNDGSQLYVTQLPTCYPEDFGLEMKCGMGGG